MCLLQNNTTAMLIVHTYSVLTSKSNCPHMFFIDFLKYNISVPFELYMMTMDEIF